MLTTVQTALSKVVTKAEPGDLGNSGIISSLVGTLGYRADHYAKAHADTYCNKETRLLLTGVSGM